MTIVCYQPFGNFVPGDRAEIPDDAVFDSAYFRREDDRPDESNEKEGEQ